MANSTALLVRPSRRPRLASLAPPPPPPPLLPLLFDNDPPSSERRLSANATTAAACLQVVFQALLGQMNADGVSFDAQAGSSDVPMHQAKVLDRSERLHKAELALRSHCADQLPELVAGANDLRLMLRVKVEDGNDLLMAENTVDELHTFHEKLLHTAAVRGDEPFALFQQLNPF